MAFSLQPANPMPLSATERVMGILGWVIALGVMLIIAGIAVLVNRQRQKKQTETDSNLDSLSPAHKKPSSFKRKQADEFQNHGGKYDELPNTADYVSYRLACNKDEYPEPHSPPIHPPLNFLPQHPYTQHGTQSSMFTYPALPGPNSPYTFPKEQYV